VAEAQVAEPQVAEPQQVPPQVPQRGEVVLAEQPPVRLEQHRRVLPLRKRRRR